MQLAPPAPGLLVLDVGCGTGTHLALYRAGGAEVTGVDRSPQMLARAAAKLGPTSRLVEGEVTDLPFAADSFDLALAMTVLHELPSAQRPAALAEMRRVTRPGGRLLVVDHDPGRPAGWRPRLTRALASGIERIAGGAHYRGYREFRASGGLPALAAATGLTVERHLVEGLGTMGIYLLR